MMDLESIIIFGFIGLTLLFVLGFAIWNSLVENPRLEKEAILFQNKNLSLFKAERSIKELLTTLKDELPMCRKCKGSSMQLWDVDDNLAIIRCTSCKTKKEFVNEVWINPLYNHLLDLYKVLSIYHTTQNDFIKTAINRTLRSPYGQLRGGSTFCRAIEFDVYGEITKKKNLPKTSRRITQKTKDLVWRRDEGKCVECGSNEKLEFDHIIPFSKGGSNTYRNIQLLCEVCNRTKSNSI